MRGRVELLFCPKPTRLTNPSKTNASVTLFIDKLRAQMIYGESSVLTDQKRIKLLSILTQKLDGEVKKMASNRVYIYEWERVVVGPVC